VLRKLLQRYRSPFPTLIDGQMRREEWLTVKPASIYKGDFEHHNFGGAELDVVDPAYDLAAASFEFRLSAPAEKKMLDAYAEASGDHTIGERLLLYKLLYGTQLMKRAARKLTTEPSPQNPQEWHQRYLAARDFVTFNFHRYCASLTKEVPHAAWSKRLIFFDLDGVFDRELLGFPHTTLSGLAAINLLQSCGFSLVLHTARSVEDVRQYCQTYTFPGGIAEHGSVFIDAVRQREIPLIEAEAVTQMVRCRNALKELPGVFLDPAYRYSVRAYRYGDRHMEGLRVDEIEEILQQHHCDRLRVIAKSHYTDVVEKDTNKGSGLLAAKRHLGCPDEPVIAIGDSELDVEMLALAETSYAPANCAQPLRELANRAKCRIMRQPFQRGLLAAAHDIVRHGSPTSQQSLPGSLRMKTNRDLFPRLLAIADRPRVWQLLAALTWWSL
jgi:hydroxymethylpyrimidine pyrophosphatase-like HAD family hydrolase